MTTATITRIRKVHDYRVFQRWTDDRRAIDFARVNLLYGTNGSGKSTLASLLRSCAASDPAAAQARIELAASIDGVESIVTHATEGFWSRVQVFNAEYVRENLRFDDNQGPRSDSLLTLGKANVDAELELAEAQNRKAEIELAAAAARSAAKAADAEVERRMTRVAGHVYEDLRYSPVATYRGTNTYTRRNVRKLLVGDRTLFDSASVDIAADRGLATSSAPRPYTGLFRGELRGFDEIIRDSEALLRADVTSKPLEQLAENTAGAEWVQRGLQLHEHETACLFCGSEISSERRAALAAHFDRSVTDLQARIDDQVVILRNSSQSASRLADSVPGDGDLYPDLAGALRTARSEVQDQVDRYQRVLSELERLLSEKRSNPFAIPEHELTTAATPTLRAVAEVIATHETRRLAHEKEASAAARRVELARVKAFAEEYDLLAESAHELDEKATSLEDELRELSQRIITLSSLDADPVPQATELTGSVARLLGRSELAFAPSDDGKQYRIERSGMPATHLSEGERTAIALLHFLASIREGVLAGEAPIVVIDDPVSSMDEGILFGLSSFLWSSLVENSYASQVFLLTHNFELFRQWVVQLEGAGRHVLGGYSIHEIRMKHRRVGASAPRRTPELDPWTSDTRQSSKLRSLYHFLFARVATSVIEAKPDLSLAERMDLLALAPNAARKMLEAFLSFRFPQHIGRFHQGMKAAIEEVNDPAIRTHVERYLHAYSHNEEGNVSAMIDPSEATVVLRSLFLLIRANDPKHLSAMCEALGIEESELFALPS
ncbi:AAA family ATPase [Microbacterium trichothecenolyticum]|uniref:Wobble nucleotide-excising tRNase n=1 Tax=Microbacterium trichothecenolyticum TaxID=69370 RepID=A0ABU0TQY9_MICTR|nr:AAA family ATPase [Microbacterium trichothecenolyticum]MDQ1122075.1 wobble nucleotide-excising tRNase [Microbacterium trichothecenolyticum]